MIGHHRAAGRGESPPALHRLEPETNQNNLIKTNLIQHIKT